MNLRKLIYIFSLIIFSPAIPLFIIGLIFVLNDLLLGYWSILIPAILLVGGGIGLVAAFLLTFDIAGNSISDYSMLIKRIGLATGIFSELIVIVMFTPNLEPFIFYWLPQLVGAIVLMILSFKIYC